MIYTFICIDCKKKFAEEIPMDRYSTFTTILCPTCYSSRVKRTYIQSIPVIFKGEGFTKSVKEEE